MKEKNIRIVSFVAALASFLLAIYGYLTFIYQAGFPDGFISELAAGEKKLFTVFCLISSFFSGIFLWLGWTSDRKDKTFKFYASTLLYLVFLIVTYYIDQHMRAHLMGSSGG